MGYKYFGRLAGSTLSDISLDDTSPPNRRSPYIPSSIATKFLGVGEAAHSRSVNRGFSALSTNLDYIAGFMDTPSVREDLLHYYAASGVSGGKFGFPCFDVTTAGDTASTIHPLETAGVYDAAIDFTEFNLGAQHPTEDIEPPAVWLYVGHDERTLRSGKVMRMYKDSTADLYDSNAQTLQSAVFSKEYTPVYIKTNSSAGSVYHKIPTGSTGSLGTASPHAPSDYTGAIAAVKTDLPPYMGNTKTVTLSGWNEDGATLAANSWGGTTTSGEGLLARPGCFALISGSTSVGGANNDGLWMIRSFRDGKAVLTRGGLIKVSVGDSTIFEAGELVSWPAGTDYNQANKKLEDRPHKAYVMYKDAVNHIVYLYPFSGAEDYETLDSPNTVSGGRVSSAMSVGQRGWNQHSWNDTGLLDGESGAGDNANLRVLTSLYTTTFDDVDSITDTRVLAMVPENAPIKFMTTSELTAQGSVKICNPPGFLLNPVIAFENDATITPPSYIHAGKYVVSCKTLTTTRERMASGGLSPSKGEADDPTAVLPGNNLDWFQNNVRNALFGQTFGYTRGLTETYRYHNTWDTLARSMLSPSVWFIMAQFGATGIGTKVEDATIAPGDLIKFVHPDDATWDSIGTVVDGWGNYIIVRDVWRDWANAPDEELNFQTKNSIKIGSTATIGGDAYAAVAVVAPWINATGTYTDENNFTVSVNEAPPPDLNTMYHRYYSSSPMERRRGLGNKIAIATGRPLTLVTPGGTTQKTFQVDIGHSGLDSSAFEIVNGAITVFEVIGDTTSQIATDHDGPVIRAADHQIQLDSGAAEQALVGWHDKAGMSFVHKDEQVLLGGKNTYNRAITSSDGATPAVVTTPTSHGLDDGEEIVIFDHTADALNGHWEVDKVDGTTFKIKDLLTGAYVDGVAGAGTGGKFFEITSSLRYTGNDLKWRNAGDKISPNWGVSLRSMVPHTLTSSDDVALVGNGVLHKGGLGSTGPGNDFSITNSVYLHDGLLWTVPTTNIINISDGVQYIYWDPDNGYSYTSTFQDTDAKLWIAKVSLVAGDITQVTDIRKSVARLGEKTEIRVGSIHTGALNGAYWDNVTHFETLGDALAAIDVWANDDGTDNDITRGYHIKVVAPCTESDSTESRPYKLPISGLIIEGDGESTITWDDANSLIDVDSKHVIVRGLVTASTVSDPAASDGTDYGNVNVFTNTATAAKWEGMHISNCKHTGGTGFLGFIHDHHDGLDPGWFKQLTIRDCAIKDVSCFGVMIGDSDSGDPDYDRPETLIIDNCIIERKTGLSISSETTSLIEFNNVKQVTITGNRLFDFDDNAILAGGGSSLGTYSSWNIARNTISATAAVASSRGIYLTDLIAATGAGAIHIAVTDNHINNIATGIETDLQYTKITGNTIHTWSNFAIVVGEDAIRSRVMDNYLTYATRPAISMNSEHSAVTSNIIHDISGDATNYPIKIAEKHCTVTGNIIEMDLGESIVDGIFLGSFADYTTVTGNVIKGGTRNSSNIKVDSQFNTITGNTLVGGGIIASSGNHNVILGNNCATSTTAATAGDITVDSAAGAASHRNTIVGNIVKAIINDDGDDESANNVEY